MLVLPQLVIYISKDYDLTLEIYDACHIATLMLLATLLLLLKISTIIPNKKINKIF